MDDMAYSDKAANRMKQLMKWKEQRDLRRKVEELEKAKKKPFRIVRVELEAVPYDNFAVKSPQVVAAKPRTTRSKSVGDVPAPRRTRSKVASTDMIDDSQRDDTSPDEPQRSRRSFRKQKSKGVAAVATRPVLGQLADSNDVDFVAKTSVEKMGAGSVASEETSARSRRSTASKEVAKRIEESGLKSAYQSENTLATPKTPEKKANSEEVVKTSGRKERRSVVSESDVSNATGSSRRRSNMSSISTSDFEPAEKTAKAANEEYLATAVKEEKQPERGVRIRRSIQGKVLPGDSISDSDSAAHMNKIPEEKLESELADEDEPKKAKVSKNHKRKSLRNLPIASNGIGTNDLAAAAESVLEITETSCNGGGQENVNEPSSQRAKETENKMVESKVQNASAVVFQTPSQPIRTMRSHSIALGPDSLKRKTPKNVRNSLILRSLSPEEGVEVLKNSPLVERNRRKLKTPPTGGRIGSQMFPVAPMPNFDDLDIDTDLSKDGSADRPTDMLSPFDAESAIVSGSAAVEPLETDDPPIPNDHPVSEPVASSHGKDVDAVGHFRRLLSSETDRLRMLCLSWKDAEQINEEVSGQIRTTIGQAELLMGQRFKQFSGLVDNCEFKTSEKEVTCTDLQGFWDMMYYQVENVDKKFSDLGKLKSVNWVMENLPLPVKPKATKKKIAKGTEAALAAKKKTTTRPNFAQFRQKLQQQEQEVEAKVIGAILTTSPTSEVKTFDGGFFKVDNLVQEKMEANSTGRLFSIVALV